MKELKNNQIATFVLITYKGNYSIVMVAANWYHIMPPVTITREYLITKEGRLGYLVILCLTEYICIQEKESLCLEYMIELFACVEELFKRECKERDRAMESEKESKQIAREEEEKTVEKTKREKNKANKYLERKRNSGGSYRKKEGNQITLERKKEWQRQSQKLEKKSIQPEKKQRKEWKRESQTEKESKQQEREKQKDNQRQKKKVNK